MRLKSTGRCFDTRALLRSAVLPGAVASRRGAMGGLLVGALASGLPGFAAWAQDAYFSMQGDLVTIGDQLGVEFNLSGLVTNADDFGGETFTNVSRANRAGQIAPTGLDSELVLFNSVPTEVARNDDGGPGLDALLTWFGLDDVNPNTSSNGDLAALLPAGDYTLNVEHFSNGGTGTYAVDLFGPANLLTLAGLDTLAGTPGTTTITSLAMGTTGAGQDEAIFDYNDAGTLTITDALDLEARSLLDINAGAVTVGGTTTVTLLGELQLDGGDFNANGSVNLTGGRLDQNAGDFNLAANQQLTATQGALITFADEYELRNNTTFSILDGDLNLDEFLDVGNATNGFLVVDGSTSTVDTNLVSSTHMDWGRGGAIAAVTVSDGATLDVNNASRIDLGVGSTSTSTLGEIRVLSGGTFNASSIEAATLSRGSASILVDGSGSTFTQAGAATLTLGDDGAALGTGMITVSNDGVYNTGTGLTTINASGTVNVTTGGTFDVNGDLNINGGSLTVDGTLNTSSGKIINATNNAFVRIEGGFDQNADLAFASGADLEVFNLFAIGNTIDGTGVFEGAGTSLLIENTGSISNIGAFGGEGVLTIRQDALMTLSANTIRLGSLGSNATGTLNIESGADFNANGAIWVGIGSTGTGTVNLTGSGSTITQTDNNRDLRIGGTGTSVGVVNVIDSAVYTTSTATTTINPTGTLNVNTGGVFNANGDVNVIGGVINRSGSANFSLAAGRTLTASDSAVLDFDTSNPSRYVIDDNTTFNVTDGSTFSVFTLDVGDGSDGTLVVDNASVQSIALGGTLNLGFAGATGTVTLRNNAQFTTGETLALGRDSNTASNGLVLIESGSDLTANNDIRVANSTGGSGTLTVTGPGSTLTQASGLGVSVGTSAPGASGTGVFTIADQAEVTLFNLNNIGATGTLNINTGGTLNVDGVAVIDGGTLTRDATSVIDLANGVALTARNNGQVILTGDADLNSNNIYTFQTGADFSSTFDIDVGVFTDATLIIENPGSTFTSIGQTGFGFNGGDAVVTVRDRAEATVNGQLSVGTNTLASNGVSSGMLDLQTGASFTVNGNFDIADAPVGTGTVTVDGEDGLGNPSTFTVTGNNTTTIGTADANPQGTGTLNVTNAAVFTTGTGTLTINPTGTLNVDTGGRFNANSDVAVNGGTITTDDVADAFNLVASGTLTATNDAQINFNGPRYTLGGGRTFNIQSGSDFTTANGLDLGSGNAGTLLVDGPGSTLDVNNGTAFLGLFSGSANVTLSNGAVGVFDNTVFLATLGNDSSATIEVESGAALTLASLTMASDTFGPSDNATANVIVTGAGSTITQQGTATLAVGGTGTGSTANLTIASGGVFNTGAGTTTVNATGTINLAAGTFNANGGVVINGGSLDLSSGTANLGLLDLNGTASVALVSATLNADTIDFTDIASAFNFTGGTLSVNTLIGILDQNGGTLAPGNSAGTTAISGYNLNSGMIAIELGGTTPGTEHDQVQVGGTLVLGAGSILDVTLINSFTPAFGESFDILDFSTVLGSFAQINLPMLGPGLVWNDTDLLVTGALSVALALPGDTDFDGDIDDADLGTSFSNYTGPLGTAGGKTPADGDTDGDGDVDDADLANSFVGYTGPLAANVPEPASLVMLLVGVSALRRRR